MCELPGRSVAQGTVGTDGIVVIPPSVHDPASCGIAPEPVPVQALVPEPSVETLDGRVLHWFARSDEVQAHPVLELADTGRGMLDIARILNGEGISSPTGKMWTNNAVHFILTNEVYTGTLVWSTAARDEAEPVRVERAFPSIVSKAQFRRVNARMRSRAPTITHPRRAASSYMFSGLAKCYRCKRALTGHSAKSGRFHYYVCQSLLKRGKGGCDTPRLNARRFEELIARRIRSGILTEGIIGDLTKVVAKELDGLVREQRRRLETIETQLADVRRRLDRLWDIVETTDDIPGDAGSPDQGQH